MFRTILGSDGGSGKFSQKHRNQQTITSDIVYINYRGHVKFIHSKKATNFCESFAYHVRTACSLNLSSFLCYTKR